MRRSKASARHLDCVGVPELVRGEAAPHPGLRGEPAELDPHGGCGPRPAAGRPVDHAEERPHRARHPLGHPGPQLAPAPVVHADLAPAPALTLADEQGTAGGFEIALVQVECLPDPQARPPKHNDQRADAVAMQAAARLAITATISSTRGGSAG